MTLQIVRAGFAAVQDLGRPGYAHLGVPRGGAFDEWALRDGNRLCGNDPSAAAIEFVLAGPDVRFDDEATVALTGAPFAATLDGTAVPFATTVRVAAGASISIGKVIRGARGLLCIAGGIATAPVLDSRSVSARAGIGRALAAGDRLPVGVRPGSPSAAAIRSIGGDIALGAAVRIVPGPQPFPDAALETLVSEPYEVTTEADRVGVRLDGPPLRDGGGGFEIDPEPVVPGAIQVPGDAQPIVLGPDAPATGGYPKIATVIRADLWMLAQARPGDTLRFEICDPAAARQALAVRLRETEASDDA